MARTSILGVWAIAATSLVATPLLLCAQPQTRDAIRPLEITFPTPPVAWSPPITKPNALPINLPTALRLVNARAMDVAIASQRIQQANAQFDQARYAWLPTVTVGSDYLRHNGRAQDVVGSVIIPTRSSFMSGAGINAVFNPTDAIFNPLAAKQVVRARWADHEAITNNTVLSVSEAYFAVQQARGELVGAHIAGKYADELAKRTEKLAQGLVPPVESVRARAEAAIRKQAVHLNEERWDIASAELIRILRLDPTASVDPVEPPHLRITLVDSNEAIDALIPIGLRNRPELESQQALIEATLQRLRQEKLRPLVPSLVLKGAGTNPPLSLSGGVFGAGKDAVGNYGLRGDFEVQVLWEFQNLMFGNKARIKERQAENQIALLEMFRLQDRIAAEIAQAHAQMKSAANRLSWSESGLKDATESVEKNFQGLSQTRRAGELLVLVVRPQEVIASIQALSQAYANYYGAVADFNRAQFRLYRALGHPARSMIADK